MSISSFPSTDYHSFDDFLDNILVDFPSQNPTMLSSGSENSTRNTNSSSNSGSDDAIDERRLRRLISNRESAKRSRKRKQMHLENLTSQVTRYRKSNQELMKRLRFVNHNGCMVRKENERLRLESVRLQQRLYNLRQLLTNQERHHPSLPSAWPCNNNVYVNTINEVQNKSTTMMTF